MNNEISHQHISTSAKFVTYLTALFELRNANFLPILSPYGTFHCKFIPSFHHPIVLSCYRAISHWFACNEIDFFGGDSMLKKYFYGYDPK